MTNPKEQTIDTLNTLIETCGDACKGFEQAADALKSQEPLLAETFTKYSTERSAFANTLKSEVNRLGGDPAKGGTFGGAMHRGWIGIRTAISSNNHKDIVEECERGEDVALKNYREALSQPLPTDIRSIVQQQKARVQEAHDHVRRLELGAQ